MTGKQLIVLREKASQIVEDEIFALLFALMNGPEDAIKSTINLGARKIARQIVNMVAAEADLEERNKKANVSKRVYCR